MVVERANWGSLRDHGKFIRDKLPELGATALVVQDMLTKYFPSDGQILDIATGIGLLPQMCKTIPGFENRIISIDNNKEVLSLAHKRNPNNVFLSADAYQLPFSNETFPYVASMNFLNSEIPDIKGVGQEILRVMRSGGTLVHFADTFPIIKPFVDRYMKEGKIPFLVLDKNNKISFTLVDMTPKRFLERFDKSKFHRKDIGIDASLVNEIVDMIRDHINDPQYLIDLTMDFASKSDEAGASARISMMNVMKMLDTAKIKHSEPIPVDELSGEYIVEQLRSAGFSDVHVEYVTRETTLSIAENKHLFAGNLKGNCFKTLGGNKFITKNHAIPAGMARLISSTQVIVAKK